MKKAAQWMAGCLISLMCGQSTAASYQQKIDQLIQKNYPNARIGVVVGQPSKSTVAYQHDADYFFTPASILKLLPATTALNILGPSFRYNTWLLTNADEIKKGVLKGNLYVQFNGDPSLLQSNLELLLASLNTIPIHRIDGHVYIDSSHYHPPPYPPGRVWDDLSYAYGAPISSVIINKNEWRLDIEPAAHAGTAGKLSPENFAHVIHLNNQTITTKSWENQCPITIYSMGPNRFQIGGCIPKPARGVFRNLAYTDPKSFAKAIVVESLEHASIQYRDTVSFKTAPTDANYLRFLSSAPLSDLISTMLKDSENIYAGSLLKTIGGFYYQGHGSFSAGLKAIRHILGLKNSRLADGSGLSRYNLITPMQMHQVLLFAYQHPRVYNTLYKDLAVPGEKGTLKRRKLLEGMNIHAKTGSMTGVQALAGYMRNKKNKLLDFVIISNDFVGSRRPLLKLEDQICQILYQQS